MRTAWLIVVVALTLSGCVRTRTIDFTVPPPESRTDAAWAQLVGVSVSVSDKRIDRTNVGRSLVPGASLQNHVIVSSRSVEEAMQQGLLAELKGRGVKRMDGPAFLLVDITKAEGTTTSSAFRIDVMAEVEFTAMVVGTGGNVGYRRVFSRVEAGKADWTLDYHPQGAYRLQKVIGDLIREMVDDDRLIQALIAANRG